MVSAKIIFIANLLMYTIWRKHEVVKSLDSSHKLVYSWSRPYYNDYNCYTASKTI